MRHDDAEHSSTQLAMQLKLAVGKDWGSSHPPQNKPDTSTQRIRSSNTVFSAPAALYLINNMFRKNKN